jgi:hypothetical protein
LFFILGSISLSLGAIGVFMPVLPTTPFLLLAAFCYLRSSQRLYNWLINHRIFGGYIYNYITYKAVTKKSKIGAIVFLWLTLIISILLMNITYVRISLLAIGAAVSIYLMTLRTLRVEDIRINESNHNRQ